MNRKFETSKGLSQKMYIIQASVEYLISLLVSGSFLATITKNMGISDSVTGVISSFISLGCLFQLISIFIKWKNLKRTVISFSMINQTLFMFLYILPFFKLGKTAKNILFMLVIFAAYFVYNVIHPKKTDWFMSLVDDGKRGKFTAAKEIASLISGMVFTMGMGAVIDRYKDAGKIYEAFILSAVVILVLMIAHTVTVLMIKENQTTVDEENNKFKTMCALFTDRNILMVMIVFSIWNIANYTSIPFYSIYQINELGFSLKFISALSIVSTVTRILFSRWLGSLADNTSFAKMLKLCLLVAACGFFIAMFATPTNGRIIFILYSIFNGFAMGGINSGMINLVYDYVDIRKRADSLAVCQSISGAIGFLATLVVSPLVAYIQGNGNMLFGISVYSQQFLSLIACLVSVLGILFIRFVVKK